MTSDRRIEVYSQQTCGREIGDLGKKASSRKFSKCCPSLVSTFWRQYSWDC